MKTIRQLISVLFVVAFLLFLVLALTSKPAAADSLYYVGLSGVTLGAAWFSAPKPNQPSARV